MIDHLSRLEEALGTLPAALEEFREGGAVPL
jgi:hypothetical protein